MGYDSPEVTVAVRLSYKNIGRPKCQWEQGDKRQQGLGYALASGTVCPKRSCHAALRYLKAKTRLSSSWMDESITKNNAHKHHSTQLNFIN